MSARLASAAIKIPKRIDRGPTDILKALASTVKDAHATEPIFSDDPFLAPITVENKKQRMISKLSGIKTARYIFNKQPELFSRDDSEPKIENFQPPEQFRADMDFSEQDLLWCIENRDIPNGIIAYQALEESDSKLSDETLIQFLEMICFTNEERLKDSMASNLEKLSSELQMHITWNNGGLADKIFNKYKNRLEPAKLYSVIMAGLSKHQEFQKVLDMFEEFNQQHPGQALYIEAYEASINATKKALSSRASGLKAIETIVGHMATNLVMPDRRIFNSILSCYSRYAGDEKMCEMAFKLFNDMKTLDVKPSLTTFLHLSNILTKFKGGRTHKEAFSEMLTYLNERDIDSLIKDVDCSNFFYAMMMNISTNIHDIDLGNSLHKLMLKRPNLFKDHQRKNRYYNEFFRIIIRARGLDKILEFYHSNVPRNFTPRGDTYDALAEILDLHQASDEIVDKIGEDIIQFKAFKHMNNDEIFRRNPKYVNEIDLLLKDTESRRSGKKFIGR